MLKKKGREPDHIKVDDISLHWICLTGLGRVWISIPRAANWDMALKKKDLLALACLSFIVSFNSPFSVMASPTLEDVLSDSGVTPQVCSILMTAGWTIENFSCVASDESSMDDVWQGLIPDFDLPLLQKSALRAGFKRCRQKMDPSGPSKQQLHPGRKVLHPNCIKQRSML